MSSNVALIDIFMTLVKVETFGGLMKCRSILPEIKGFGRLKREI